MATNSEEIIRSVEEPQADDTQQLYNNLKEDGYEDIGTLDEFRANVANREMSDQLYNNLKEDGYEDLGTSDEFFSRLNPAEPSSETPEVAEEQTMPNVTGEQTTQQQPAIPTIDPELEASAKLGGVIEKAKDAPAPDTVPGTQEWRNRTVNIPGENPYNGQTYGAVYDSIIQDFGKNMTHPDVDPYAEARAKIMQAGITDDLKPEDADKLALNIREGYANRYAEGEAKNIVSALPDQVPNIDQLMDGLWYTRDLQNSIAHEAQRLGLRQENYVNYYVKPQIAKALSDRYGYDVESAKHIAARLLSQEGHMMSEIRQREANDMIGKYALPYIEGAFEKIRNAADEQFEREAGPDFTPNGLPSGQVTTSALRRYQNMDPEKVWGEIEPKLNIIGSSIVADENFWNEAIERADEEGIDVDVYIKNRIKPMLDNIIQREFERIAVENEMPKDDLNYILNKAGDSFWLTIGKAIVESKTRQRARREAMQKVEMGQADYKPSTFATIAGGAAPMAIDMATGAFNMAGKAARPFAQIFATEGIPSLTQRVAQAMAGGSATLGSFEAMKGATQNLLLAPEYDSLLQKNSRSFGKVLEDVFEGAIEHGGPSAVAGLGMVGGAFSPMIANGRGAIASLLGWGTQTGIDAAAATGLSVVSGDVKSEDAGKNFLENLGTFFMIGAHGKGRELRHLAGGGRLWNGVEFSKSEVDRINDRYGDAFRDIMSEAEKTDGGLISNTITNNAAGRKEAASLAGAELYNDMMRSYSIPRDTKVKIARATRLPLPDYVIKPEVLSLSSDVPTKIVDAGMIDMLNEEYNRPGGIAEKTMNGEPLNNYELMVRLLFQDNAAFNAALEKQRAGQELTPQEQELIDINRDRFYQIQKDYFNRERNRIIEEFEKENNLKEGTIRAMLDDVAEGKPVDNYIMSRFEDALRDQNMKLDEAKAAQEAEAAKVAEETAEVEQPTEEATVEEAPKVNRAVDNAEGETPVGRTDGKSTPAAPPVNQTTGKVMEVELVDGRKAYVVDGDPNNPEGLISLVDENGQPVRMTRNGYTFDRFSPEIIQKDEKGYPKVTEPKDLPNKEENTENETVVSSGDLVSKEGVTETTAMSKIKVAEDGTELWEESPVEDTIAALRERVGDEETRQMVDEQIEDISAELNDLTKVQKGKNKQRLSMGDRIKKREAIADTKKRLEYWNQVKEVLDNEQADSKGQEMDSQHTDRPAGSEGEGGEGQVQVGSPAEGAAEDLSVQGKAVGENVEAGTPVSDNNVSGGAPAEEKPVEPTAEQKIALGTVRNNIDKRFSFQNQDGTRSEVTVDLLNGDKVSVTRQDYDLNGNPKGEPYKQDLNLMDVGNSIVNGTLKPVLSTEEKLRNAYKGKIGMQNVIDVLTDEERQRMLDAVERKDQDALNEMTNEFLETHKEDMILNERDKRNDAVSRIMEGGGSREDKLRRVRKEFQGYDDAVMMLSDEAMQPTTLEEYVADLHSRQPKAGEGPLAYFSYDKDGKKVVGMQDETGHGTKSGGDTKGYAPWLAPKGKGMSLQQYAETIHSQLPEAVQQQYSDQDVRNAIIEVFGSAERPSDITTMVIRRGIIQAEQAARRMEEMWIDGAPDFHKVPPVIARTMEEMLNRENEKQTDTTEPTPENIEKAFVTKLSDVLKDSAVPYSDDVDEGQKIIDEYNGKDLLSKSKKRALETASLQSSDEDQPTVVSSADGAKVLKNLDTLVKDFENLSNQPKFFIGSLAKKLGAKRDGSKSEYATFETKNGKIVTIRLADHNATVSDFDHRNENDGISIVITAKDNNNIINDGNAHVIEFFYDAIKLRRAEGKPLVDIIKSIKQSLYSGEYKDTTGLAEREEVNADEIKQYKKAIRQQKVEQPIFVSNAEKAVEAIKQDKATPEQWLKMIEKNGGLKAGEDKWLELRNWLENADVKTLTKQQVLDYINSFKIQIEEQKYREYFDLDSNPKMQEYRKEFAGILDELKKGQEDLRKEMEDFDQKMYDKYGEGWVDKLDKEDQEIYDAQTAKYGKYEDDLNDAAFREMESRHGDDFGMAFEYNYGNGKLEPTMDMYGDDISDAAKHFLEFEEQPINSTRLGYTTQGLDNRREIALTVPTVEPYNESDQIHFGDAGDGRAIAWIRFGDTTAADPELIVKRENAEKAFYDFLDKMDEKYNTDGSGESTYDKLNPEEKAEGHRLNDERLAAINAERDDKKRVLVIDEIQSKRHQDGREKGYKDKRLQELDEKDEEAQKKYHEFLWDKEKEYGYDLWYLTEGARDLYGSKSFDYDSVKKEDIQKEHELHQASLQATKDLEDYRKSIGNKTSNVPDAPFEKNWHELAMKRMLRYAAENGYDKIAWTTGEQQAERYDLSKQIDEIQAIRNGGGYQIDAIKDGKSIYADFYDNEAKLAEVIGKDLASKIFSNQDTGSVQKYNGLDLKIGGEGMKGFYDDILPRFMDKYGKKWGVKTGEIDLPDLEKSAQKMHSVDVTPEMKESVMQGQPMFFKTPDGQAYGFTYKGKIYVDPRIATAETPIHEYGHLWAEMKRQTAKEEWNHIKDVLLKDKLIEPIIEKVRREYPELEGKEDDFVEEVLTQFSGKHGAEKLRQMAEEIKQEMGKDAAAETIAEAAIRRVKSVLNEFWKGVADMMGWKYTSAEDIADRILSDMLNGVNPVEKMKEAPKDLKSQQEIERTLMGVHNLSEEKLRKALKVGGLANPSMAVVDTKQHMHTDYGDISLIPRASLIDARTGRNAGTFTADAWTPSYPQVVRRMTDKGQTKFWKDIRKLNEEAGEVASQMRMAFDTWLDKEAGQERLAYWYLSEKGLKPELVLNENPYDKEVIKRLDELTDNGNKSVSSLPEEQIKEIADMYHAYKEKIGEPVTPAEERIKKLEARIDPNKQSPFTNLQKFRIEELQKYGELLHSLSDFVYRAGRASFYEGKPNVDATMRKAQEVVKSQNLQADFDKWLDQKAQDYGVEEWLFNGTDYQGRQKWVRNTLDNASKLMKKEGLNGAVGWSSLGSWIATVANKEKTLEGIRRNKKNLNTTEEEHDAWKEQWGEKLYPLVEKLGNGDVFHGDNILKDILEHKDFAGYYKREYGKELTKDERDLIDTFIKEVRTNFPTGYFETKFERPVMLDEFEIAVVPETTSPDIVEALKNAGIDVRTYDASDYDKKNENRTKAAMDAVSGRDDIMFQMVGRKGAAKADETDNNSERIRTLNVAKDAAKAGIDPKAIKFATGWEKGKDGKWRYEIPDADVDILGAYKQARLAHDKEVSRLGKEEDALLQKYQQLGDKIPARLDNRYTEEQKEKYRQMREQREELWKQYIEAGKKATEYDEQGVSISLGELLGEGNDLFKYYPEMKDMRVRFATDMEGGTAGSFGDNRIDINYNELHRFDGDDLNNESVYGILLHEVQHAIQEIEGFAPGGNLYTSTTETGINAIIEKKQRQAADIKLKLDANRKILSNPEELKAAAELDGKSEKEVKDQLLETINQEAADYDQLQLQIEKIKNTKAPAMSDARDLYNRLAGEVESRNVTTRMKMTPDERRKSLASETEDVSREDQVIINSKGGLSASMGDEAPKFQRASNPEPELTPEERQYWNKWADDMKKWREQNAIPAEAEEPGEKPQKSPDEDMMDYVLRLTQYNKDKAVWKTAPKLDDYLRQRSDKDALEAARENLERYPDSPLAKMRMAAAEFQQIRTAMGRQKAYDKATVKAVTDFAQEYMKMGFGDNLSRGEMERMLSAVKNATGAKDIRQQIDSIMNILTDNYLRNLDQQVQKLSSVKELKQTAQGVEAQGKLELKGQRMIQAFREARQTRMTADEIRERMAEVSEYMARNDEEAPMWEQEYEGLSIALQYVENIEGSRSEYGALDREYRDAVKNYRESGRSYKAQQEYLEELDKAMMENKLERIGMFGDLINRLQGNIAESMQGAKEFVEREKQRIAHIQKIANYDLAGKDMGAMRERSKGKPANFFLQPLATFEQMLKQFGSRNANGEGYLYDYFMRKWIDSVDQAFLNEQRAKQELDDKAKEVFGDNVKRWSDLYKLIRNEKEFPGMDVEITDQGEDKEFHLNQGNLLYIYMANKMTDGAMKLRKMGITEEDVNAIKEHLDPRLIQLGDWLQDEYLVQKRTEYNKVHERMFGAPMAAIDHYFPIRILGDARVQEQDVANMADQDAVLPSTITGNIIKRRRNSLPLDILHTDALSLAIEHIEDMERWAATAEWNKDINTLLSYTTFRNKVKNMKTIYGSGDALWNTFADTARMAAGTYRPKAKPGSVDKTISNIAKGVTAAKISFRAYTAFKQTLSAPAFLHDVNLGYFIKNSVNPYGSWKWAMENMPVFNKRWKSRQVGDTRLMDDPTDWKMWKTDTVKLAAQLGMSPNALVDGITCAVGARSIYQSRVKKYKDMGMDEEKAEKRALQDAEVGYNLTQQSSEGAFVSAIQKDRTVAANMLSVFRNSSMAYTRQWVDAARNLKHRMQPGYREDSIGFMAKQFEEILGLDEAKAQEAAEKEYARAARHDIARMLNFMFGVTVAWNLGASLPYLLIGDDDETKKEMLTDAFIKGMVAGPSEGFAAGNIISELVGRSIASAETRNTFENEGLGAAVDAGLKQAGDYEVNPLPLFADIQGMIKKMGYDKYAAAQDLFNIVMQSAVGVNPQTFTDIWNACMDYGNPSWMPFTDSSVGNDDLANAKEIALFIMRLTNAPTSSWRNKYIDELGMGADEAKNLSYDEMARRYANYKHWKDAPVMGWFRSDEARQAKMEKIVKQFDKAVQERMGLLKDEDVAKTFDNTNDLTERKMLGKEQAKRTDSEDAIAGGIKSVKNPEKRKAVERYVKQRTWQDLVDDLELAKAKRTMSADYKARREEAERRSMVDVKEFDKTEANIQTKQLLKDINKVEKDIKALRETIGTDNNDDERWQQIRSKRDEILNKIRAIQQK